MSTFPQSLSFLIAFWLNSFVHGIYIVLFLQWLFLKDKKHSIYFVAICWFTFIASNFDFALNVYLMVQGFWFWLPKGGPDVFFADLSNWQTVVREFNYQLLVSVCDSFMVYRLFRIWNGNYYITIIPILLLLCETAFGLIAPSCLATKNFVLLEKSIDIFLGFNTSLQIVITVLIAFKLLNPQSIKYLPAENRARRFQIVRCIVESGLLVTVVLIFDLAFFAEDNLFHWVFNISLTQVYAITTVLIVLRINNLRNPNNTNSNRSLNTVPSTHDYPRLPQKGISPNAEAVPTSSNNYADSKISKEDTELELKAYEPVERVRNSQGVAVLISREQFNNV